MGSILQRWPRNKVNNECRDQRSISTHLSVDVLDVTGALRVAVASTELGTSLVGGVLGLSTILVHLDEVESTIEATRKLGDIDVKGELLVKEVEHLVVVVVLHEVDTGADVGALALGDELQGESVAAGGDTIGRLVVTAFQGTLRSAGRSVGADSGVPGVATVAVGVAVSDVNPSPVGVEGDRGAALGRAATASALLPGKLGVDFGGNVTGQLRKGSGSEREREESRTKHLRLSAKACC
jgi:hypothetical protein